MKNIKSFIVMLFLLLMLPIFVHAEDTANVTIKEVSLVNKEGEVEIIEEPKVTGLNIDFGVKFSNVEDKVIYKAVIENKDNEDYLLKLPESKNDGYVTYLYNFSDNSEILKANSTKELVITIEYKQEVPDSALENGRYKENNKVVLTLAGGKTISTSPKTGQSITFLIVIAIVIFGTVIVILKNHKSTKNFIFLLILGICILPVSIYAIKELTITVNSTVEIARTKEFCVISKNYKARGSLANASNDVEQPEENYYEFRVGMTFNDYFNSEEYKNINFETTNGSDLDFTTGFANGIDQDNFSYNYIKFFTNEERINGPIVPNVPIDKSGTFESLDSVIKDKSVGCYSIGGPGGNIS